MPYVVIPTNHRINHIGGVVGPFDSKELAQEYIDQAEYATPEEVEIHPFHAPGRIFTKDELEALRRINEFYLKHKDEYDDDIVYLIDEVKRFVRREYPGGYLPEFMIHLDDEVVRFVRD